MLSITTKPQRDFFCAQFSLINKKNILIFTELISYSHLVVGAEEKFGQMPD